MSNIEFWVKSTIKMQGIEVRKGQEKDVKGLLELIRELAEYEKSLDQVIVTEEVLLEDGFGDEKMFEFYVAVLGNQIIGIALYYYKYSTWKGRCVYLEDIVVSKSHRRKGVGRMLFDKVRDETIEIGAKRMEWQVLNWNDPAIAFYKGLGAHFDDEWLNVKLADDQLIS
jgi:GNAT superfamily N-acetyltransferase